MSIILHCLPASRTILGSSTSSVVTCFVLLIAQTTLIFPAQTLSLQFWKSSESEAAASVATITEESSEASAPYDEELLGFNDCQNLCEHCLFCCGHIYDSTVCSQEDYYAPYLNSNIKRPEADSSSLFNNAINTGSSEQAVMERPTNCEEHCLRSLVPMCACKAHYGRL